MTSARNPFEALFQSPEYKAREAAYQYARAKRRAAFLAEHGDERAAFRATPQEEVLRAACEPLLGPGETWNDLYRLAGWDWCDGFDEMPESLIAAVSDAWPMPKTVEAAWAEYQATESRTADRQAFSEEYGPPGFIEARQRVVQVILDTLPAQTLADLRARLSWLDMLNELGAPRVDVQRARLATLRCDIERMGRGF
jgi:hypothetical protein